MVGDGPERAQAQWLARQKGIADRVHFVGKQPDIPAYLSLADLLLLPSESESFGLAALEAMACEVPVIASCTGGLPELVTPGETGFLAEVGDIHSMTEYAYRLLTDNALHRRMRQACRRTAVERFNADDIVARYEAYYGRVLEQFHARHGQAPAQP
jgi:N-acetyl-alpha-D-glucosaminyl L-malate synthase BshA